jgi:hypothetical protein
MISEEEAKQTIEDWTNIERMTVDSIDAVRLIAKIYASIGSCGECKYSHTVPMSGLHCSKHIGLTNNISSDWFCKDFEKEETGGEE